ncbi:alpha/beta hydrolase family protein [Kribbella italica]|uniref:Pimeloyl-ACP methyl ester carboxylesterase n=1 Tax=Kribbella italica TaxID=1540520 RepID=A0A7W9JCK9_9ACTN|nr:alpha/beta hydrolase [Kribbella italica]MBB5838963.1 pimeloyl-ACP methyl ester carboxylesterase [Kribbella italica]
MDISSSEIVVDGRPGLLTVPADGVVRGGVVALHGSSSSSYRQVIFEHLAETVAPLGIAVLSFERAPWDRDDVDIPFDVQAAGAVAAYDVLQSQYDVPIGFWGVSQGTWIAALAARERDAAFLVLLGCSGVSPAEQMRHATAEAVRRAGYDEQAVGHAVRIRDAVANLLRGTADRHQVIDLLQRQANEPWFDLVGLTADDLGENLPVWHEIDFDSEPLYATVRCPVLLIHGADEANLPVPETLEVWRRAAQTAGNTQVTSVRVPDTGHWPGTPDRSREGISPAYTKILEDWFSTTP